MKWTKLYGAVVAMLGMVGTANAGSILLTGFSCGGAEKSCGCAPSCQPQSCRPVICRPSCPKVCTYQRSCCKPGSSCGMGANGCAPKACAPAATTCAAPAACAPAPAACAPAPVTCAAPAACAPAACGPAPVTCAAPAACAPAPATCAAPASCAPAPANCAAPAPVTCGPAPATCAAPAPVTCGPAPVNCGPAQAKCCDTGCQKNNCCADPCEVAHWIYESQTGCYAKCRRNALKKLGKYDCTCNPEIMCAFAYGLNDADECVRKEAAVQIRKQVKCHPQCCNCKVTAALTCALADCDKGVRREAEKALCACGFDVQDCCDKPSCGTGCGTKMACAPANCAAPSACGTAPMSAPTAPAEGGETAPAPAPAPAAAEPEAYFPSRLKNQQTKAKKSGLANLFGLRG